MADDAPVVIHPTAQVMPPMKTAQPIIYIVVGTIALLALMCTAAFIYMACNGMSDSPIATSVKEIDLMAIGALVGLLGNTRSSEVTQPQPIQK